MSLSQIAQDDFAVGTLLGLAPDVQPGVGAAQVVNGLINDDGDIYLRGSTGRVSDNTVAVPLTWVWSGKLDQDYVILATDAAMYYLDGATITALGVASGLSPGAKGAVIGHTLYLPNGVKLTGAAGVLTPGAWAPPASLTAPYDFHLATITGRLIVASGDTIAFSSAPTPGAPIDPEHFLATDFHRLPGGVSIRGLYAIQDTLEVFTNYGLWTVTNMAFDLTDADGNVQQTLSQIVPDLTLLGEGGLTPYKGRVVAACSDGVYLVDLLNPPTRVSDSIAPLWADLIQGLNIPGGAKVYHETLFLPMITPSVAIGGMQWTMLTCRLNRPTRARYVYYPWTELRGHAAQQSMFDFYATGAGEPRLLSAGADGYVDDLTNVISGSGGADADGLAPELIVETRDFPTGQGQPNHLKRIRISYTAQTFANAELELSYSTDPNHEVWTTLPPQAFISPGDDPLAWWISPTRRARHARIRMRLQDPLINFTLRRVELQARTAAHAR